jgi:hypothetical protein
MIGGMLGCRSGLDGIPSNWLDGLRERDEIISEADELCLMTYGHDPRDKSPLAPWVRTVLH